jgi:hypothetical protein
MEMSMRYRKATPSIFRDMASLQRKEGSQGRKPRTEVKEGSERRK